MKKPVREIVEAGAGCGKTYGLVTRYLGALGIKRDQSPERTRFLPGKILTLTFTNDAASEMKTRIADALQEAAREDLAAQVRDEGRISTFHSFCYTLIKPHLLELGYADTEVLSVLESQAHKMNHVLKTLSTSSHSENVQKLVDLRRLYQFCVANWRRPRREMESEIRETYRQVQDHWKTWRRDSLELFAEAIKERRELLESAEHWPYIAFEGLNDNNWELLKTVAFNRGPKWYKTDFLELYHRVNLLRDFAKDELYLYLDPESAELEVTSFGALFDFLEDLQSEAPKLLDFDALEVETFRFLKSHPDKVPRFDLIIVDEFQDTNRRQIEILELLSHAGTELYYVGDPKQAIYSFRGGDHRVFEAQKSRLEVSSLDINRRSLPNSLEFMNALTKRAFAEPGDPEPQLLHPSPQKAALNEKSTVTLTRVEDFKSSAFWDTLAEDLRRAQSEAGANSAQAILCQQWSRAFLAHEELSRRGLRTKLGNDLDLSRHHLSPLWIAFLKTQDGNKDAIKHWNQLAREWRLESLSLDERASPPQDPRGWLRLFVSAVMPKRWPQGETWLAALEGWIQNHSAQLRWVPTARELAATFQKSMNLRLSLDSPEPVAVAENENPPIVVTTIHKSKGLQYHSVFLFDLFDGRLRGGGQSVTDADEDESLESLPLRFKNGKVTRSLYFRNKKSTADARLLAEKKRLFYVAYTRAESHLFFYLPPSKSGKTSDPSPLSEIWGWSPAQGTSWAQILDSAAADLSLAPYLKLKNIDNPVAAPAETPASAERWIRPMNREATPKLAAFCRSGARAYIDEVLFSQNTSSLAGPYVAPEDPLHPIHLGSALHKTLETWDGDLDNGKIHLQHALPEQKPVLMQALQSLAAFGDLRDLWQDARQHPERVQREIGLFVHGDDYRLSGFADLVWFPEPDRAVILDWKTSSSSHAAFDAQKIAKTKAQVGLYAQAFAPLVKKIEVWSLAIVFERELKVEWLFRESI